MTSMFQRSYLYIAFCVVFLLAVYISQQFNYLEILSGLFGFKDHVWGDYTTFIFNKSLRFFVNDSTMVLIIWLIWKDKTYVKLALFVELFGLLVLLPLYFSLKLYFEGTSEISTPLLSFLHRLIVNPTLMILLIPAIYYQRSVSNE